jgi:hypothetical protein
MKSTIEFFLELSGGLIFLYATIRSLTKTCGYGKHYDKMMFDEDSDEFIKIKGKDIEKNND